MQHLIPVSGLTTVELADAFVARVYCLHGCTDNIVSDRGTQFISQFWTQLLLRLGIILKHSSSFYPETDGQTERINTSVEAYLRAFMNFHQNAYGFLMSDDKRIEYNWFKGK
jgi:transposase InsO family protein